MNEVGRSQKEVIAQFEKDMVALGERLRNEVYPLVETTMQEVSKILMKAGKDVRELLDLQSTQVPPLYKIHGIGPRSY